MPRVLGGSYGGGRFLMSEVPLYGGPGGGGQLGFFYERDHLVSTLLDKYVFSQAARPLGGTGAKLAEKSSRETCSGPILLDLPLL